ncbi:MAG TPA: hypothetical protein VFZ83_03935 [Acidimicrobiia bacterium]|nr:hypothetical protein [Acidimicrobiia bacterium]
MILVPVLVLAVAGFAIYTLAHGRAVAAHGAAVSVERRPFLPTSPMGWAALVAVALVFVNLALVNVVQVPFLAWILLLAALGCSGAARFAYHDRSGSVLVVLVVTTLSAIAAVLFLAGEVFIGHD